MDLLARDRVVAVARHEDEGGDEAVEPVEAQEHAHLGTLAQLEDAQRGGKQLVLADLNNSSRGKMSRIWASALPSWLLGARPARALTFSILSLSSGMSRAGGYRRSK